MAAMEKQLAEQETAEARGLEVDIASTTSQVKQMDMTKNTVSLRRNAAKENAGQQPRYDKIVRQKLGQCERCGYMSSQAICKACVLLEGLNKARPKTGIEVG